MFDPKQPNPNENKVSRRGAFSAYLYLAMALLIVGVATASIFALNRSLGSLPEVSIPDFSFGNDSSYSSDVSNAIIPIIPDDSAVFGHESGIRDESSNQPAMNEEPQFYCPVASQTVLKPCALDTLVFSETMKDYRVHTGLDLAAPVGSAVRCYTDGTVESIRDDAFYGKTVTIRHEYGLVTVYANLQPELAADLAVGKQLKAGALIGQVGSSAIIEAADQPHLHFEMLQGGAQIDPQPELFD